MEYLLVYITLAIGFFIIALRGVKTYSLKIVVYFTLLALIWPLVLIIYYLSDKE